MMLTRLKAYLLHVANTGHHWRSDPFYELKDRLCRKYGRFAGHDIQEIRKECWGPRQYRDDAMGDWDVDYTGCKGTDCTRCNGTGVFDLRHIRLERWELGRYVFHRPAGETRVNLGGRVDIHGRVEHRDYGRAATEAELWLYLLCGEWRMLWKRLRGSSHCSPGQWPFCWVQKVVMETVMRLRWRKCWCGRWFPTRGTGWQVCRRCRNRKFYAADVPF